MRNLGYLQRRKQPIAPVCFQWDRVSKSPMRKHQTFVIYFAMFSHVNSLRRTGLLPGAAGMTPEHRLTLIIETIRALQLGTPVSKGLVTLLRDPCPDAGGGGLDQLLQAAAARIKHAPR